MNNRKNILFTVLLLIALLPNIVNGQSVPKGIDYGNNEAAGNYIKVNGVNQYYEVYGQGEPLVLIHGNAGNIAFMKPQIEYFAKKYQVIVMDCRGRGRSELGADSLTYTQITEDIVSILDKLHLDSVYVVGRSDGGIIALLLAIHHPERVKKAVAFAANLVPGETGLYPMFFSDIVQERKLAEQMLAKNDTTKNWKIMQQKNRLMEFQPNISIDDLKKISCPVLIMSTDRDMVREEHTLFIYKHIAKANLSMLSGEHHFVSYTNPDLFNTVVDKYLKESFKGESLRRPY